MTCHEATELASDYLDQRLSPMNVTLVEEHLATCKDCSAELDALRETISLIGALDRIEPSPGFIGKVNRRIEGENKKNPLWAWLSKPTRSKAPLQIAALFLVSVIGIYLYSRYSEPAEETTTMAPAENFRAANRPPSKPSGRAKQQAEGSAALKHEEQVADARRSEPSSVEEMKAPEERAVAAAPRPEIVELSVEDVERYVREVNALLPQIDGRLLAEEGSPDSAVLLSVEIPQSRRTEFLAALGSPSGSMAGRLLERDPIVGQGRSGASQRAAPAAKTAPPAASGEEPRTRLHLRILRKN